MGTRFQLHLTLPKIAGLVPESITGAFIALLSNVSPTRIDKDLLFWYARKAN
jgi:hypothetical protein